MKLAELKSEFHNLIDRINDPEIIQRFYNAMNQSLNADGAIWQSLTPAQQQSVIDTYEKSKDNETLITLYELKTKYANWYNVILSKGTEKDFYDIITTLKRISEARRS